VTGPTALQGGRKTLPPSSAAQPTLDRAAMLRDFAALPARLQMPYMVATLCVYANGVDDPLVVDKFAAKLAQDDRREARRRPKPEAHQ
jgi:hypothetical protein